jgi:NAD(P)-dependent dehydrogenase (short-subunit alcohol dehydrogenase family)
VGRGIALAYASEGAAVVVLGRTASKLEAVAGELELRGAQVLDLRCDVEHREDIRDAVEAALRHFGRIDIVVNNAQTLVYKSVRKLADADLESMWHSGPVAALRFMQESFSALRESSGCVINLGSGSSILPRPAMSGYAMAKEAMRVLSRVTALEWARYGIRVNAICPLAESPGFESFSEQVPGAAELDVLPMIPLGRMGDPEHDIGRAAVFLASPDAAYITGTTLMVDGGFTYLR